MEERGLIEQEGINRVRNERSRWKRRVLGVKSNSKDLRKGCKEAYCCSNF